VEMSGSAPESGATNVLGVRAVDAIHPLVTASRRRMATTYITPRIVLAVPGDMSRQVAPLVDFIRLCRNVQSVL
jgi:hypothetical protein